ncbi:unnamed protein product [Ectocarpus sp. 8 AP-2014]
MRKMGRTGSTTKKWTSRSGQGLLLTMVLVQNSLTVPPALAEKFPMIGQRGGKEDETAAAAATPIASGQDLSRPNGLRREGYPFSRGDRQRHQQLRTKQERIPYAPVSWNHHDQEHRKLDRTTKGDPKLSLEPEILEDGNSPLIYSADTTPPANGACPVALHNSNAAVLREDRDNAAPSTVIAGALSVWKRLRQAATASSRLRCPSPPCCLGMHAHTYQGGDLGEEMSHIQGAVVVRRPDLVRAPGSLAPAHDLDFVKTFQSYFQISQSSLLRCVVSPFHCSPFVSTLERKTTEPISRYNTNRWEAVRLVEADGFNLTSTTQHVLPAFKELFVATSFLGAVREGNPAAAELLTPYCSGEDPRRDIEECVRIPTLVSMANVYTNKKGAVWNENDYIIPVNCQGPVRHEFDFAQRISAHGLPRSLLNYDKVLQKNQIVIRK